jgi:NAD(P)-dependent dehydrogenase (short-subunit alcohol dehydrogenase family)
VCVNYRSDAAAAAEVVAHITAGGGRAVAMQADLGLEAQVEAMFLRVDTELGTLSALVNNAVRPPARLWLPSLFCEGQRLSYHALLRLRWCSLHEDRTGRTPSLKRHQP